MKEGKRKAAKGKERLLPFFLLLLPLFLGCSKSNPGDKAKKPKKPDKLIIESVELGAGSTTVYTSSEPKAPISFTVRWQRGGFKVVETGIETGRLNTVSGDLYSNGKKSGTYEADRGNAVREAKRLTMTGGVVLRSADGESTLRAPKAEYRGDVGLVRATGGVTATGPFGTLTGVPELWTTPDLRLIGTPDMVSQKLKIPALVALAATAATGSPKFQKTNEYSLENAVSTKLEVVPNGRRVTAAPKPGTPIIVRIGSRDLVLRISGTVIVDFAAKGFEVRHMTTSGAVNIVQTANSGVTTIDGRDAEYDWKAGAEIANLDLGGPVKIVQTAKVRNGQGALVTQTTTTKGDKGRAVLLNKPAAGQEGLKSASLTGNVTIDVSEVDGQAFSGSGNRLVYTPSGATSEVEMSGRTRLTSVSKTTAGSRTVISQGDRGTAVLVSDPQPGANPLKNAVLDGNVSIDVSGSNGETFKGSGDKIVYTATGERARAVMTGNLKFFGDVEEYVGNVTDVDTAIMTLGRKGWETVETSNSGGKPTTTTIQTKPKPKTGGQR